MHPTDAPLTALLIAPNRELAENFRRALAETGAFEILAELRAYPPPQTLELRLHQLRPDVVLLDLASNLEQASELIRLVAGAPAGVQVVGLHVRKDSDAVVRSLRLGAGEFLHEPFDAAVQQQAVARLRRLRRPEAEAAPVAGCVVAFAGLKPGAGASTLASQTAFALQRRAGGRVLLADLDLEGGMIAGCWKLSPPAGAADALSQADRLTPALWSSLVAQQHGIDVLAAPVAPDHTPPAPERLRDLLAFSRLAYRWVVADAPAVPHRTALAALWECDAAVLISTPELASLHLARRTLSLLDRLGLPRERFRVAVNRASRRDDITRADIAKVINCPIAEVFPEDPHSLHRAISLGRPLENGSKLGRAVEQFAARLASDGAAARRPAMAGTA